MPSTRQIRRQIRAVQSTAKITRAMEMIATSKMRRAQEAGLAGRAYAQKIQQVLADLAALREEHALHPLLERREVKRVAVVHITPDRGLCGGLHAAVNRTTLGFIVREHPLPVSVITVGRKGVDFMRRFHRDIRAEFSGLGDRPNLIDTLPISRIIMDDYSNGLCDMVYLTYAQFISTTVQKPTMLQILPVAPAAIPQAQNVEYLYEPGPTHVLGQLLPRFVEMEVFHAILEAIASEQSARVVAMRSATDNANELVQHLTLLYNKARQESITKELLEIVGGAMALTE